MTEAIVAEDLSKRKGFNLFKKKEQPKEEIPVPVPPKKEDAKQPEMTEQEVQINTIFMHLQRCQDSLELASKELMNLIKNG